MSAMRIAPSFNRLAAFFYIFMFLLSHGAPCIAEPITVIFRYDDYSSRTNTELERKLIEAFRASRIPCTFGVVPFACSGTVTDPAPQRLLPLLPAKVHLLKKAARAGVVEVALHGYSHQTTMASGGKSEFGGLAYPEQKQRLAQGKAALEKTLGLPVLTFIPPWGRYDLNTVEALEQTGFEALSASIYGVTRPSKKLAFVPCICEAHQLRRTIEAARRTHAVRLPIVALFHEYDFREVNPQRGRFTLKEFQALLAWVKAQPDVRTVTVQQAVQQGRQQGPLPPKHRPPQPLQQVKMRQ